MMLGGMLLFWILLVLGIVWFVKYQNDQNRSTDTNFVKTEDPIEILKKRYARGEINKKEFEERKQVINQ